MGTIKWEMFSATEFPPSQRAKNSGVALSQGLESKVGAQGEEIAQSQTHPGKSSEFSPRCPTHQLAGSPLQPVPPPESKQIAVSSAEHKMKSLACF